MPKSWRPRPSSWPRPRSRRPRPSCRSRGEWQDKADAAWRAARDDLAKAHSWNLFNDAKDLAKATVETGIALYDEGRAGLAMAAYVTLAGIALGLQAAAEFAEGTAQLAALMAKGAAKAANVAAKLADAAAHAAHVLAAVGSAGSGRRRARRRAGGPPDRRVCQATGPQAGQGGPARWPGR